jgi:very-short-patch-repair endonuclease
MAELGHRAQRRLADQHGAASIPDLLESGMSRWEIGDVVRRGGLVQVLPGAYRTPTVHETVLVRCVAVSRARPETVICGPTAALLRGVRRVAGDRSVDVLAPPASNPSVTPWLVPFRTASWSDSDVEERSDGIRLLRYPRLALDLARFVCDTDLLSVIEQCMHDGRCDDATMRSVAVEWCTPQRGWVKRYLRALDRRVPGPAAESHVEAVIGDRLSAAGLRGLVRQHWIRPPGHRRIRFDLAVPEIRWAVEVDGFPTHRETDGARADRERDNAAAAAGWLVRRIGPGELGSRLDATIEFLCADASARRTQLERTHR